MNTHSDNLNLIIGQIRARSSAGSAGGGVAVADSMSMTSNPFSHLSAPGAKIRAINLRPPTRHHSGHLSVGAVATNGSPTYPPNQVMQQASPTLTILNSAGPSLPPPGPNLTTQTTPITTTSNVQQPNANPINAATQAPAAATDG